MRYHAQKLLCSTIIVTLLNSSLQPLYAVSHHYNKEELSAEKPSRPRLFVPENVLPEQTKASVNGQQLASEFIKNIASQAYTKMSSYVKSPDDTFSHELKSLKEYFAEDFAEDFAEEIEDMKTSTPNRKHRLKELQNIVWKGELSPYEYEQGLKELKPHASKTLLKAVQDQFQTTLKSFPAFINGNFQRDLITYLEDTHVGDTRIGDIRHSEKGIKDFEDLLTYYRQLQNPLDYTETLVGFRGFIQKNQNSLNLTDPQYWALNKAVVKAVKQRDAKEYSALKANSKFIQSALQELPYYGEETPEGFNSSLSSRAKKAAIQEESFSFMSSLKGLSGLTYKGVKYVVEHPVQAITFGLASQVVASAALNIFKPSQGNSGALEGYREQYRRGTNANSISYQSSPPLSSRYSKRVIGDEFQINQEGTVTNYGNSQVKLADLNNDNAFGVWIKNTGISSPYGRIFSANGTALNNEFSINQVTSNIITDPSVVSLTNGNVFSTWTGYHIATSKSDICGRIFFTNGTALSNEFIINQVATYSQLQSSVTSLTNGNAFVVWRGGTPSNGDVYGRIFSANGISLTNEFPITTTATALQNDPSVASLTNGNAFVVWEGSNSNLPGSSDIFGRVFSANGFALSNEISINQAITSSQIFPSVVGLANGNAFVTWWGIQTGDFDIYARIFSMDGTAVSNEFRINQILSSWQIQSSVTRLTNGNAFVTWVGDQTGDLDIYGRLFFANGTAIGNEFGINQVTISNQTNPSAVELTDGNVFVVWGGNQNGIENVYGRIFGSETPGITSTTEILTTNVPTTSMMTTGIATSGSTITSLTAPLSTTQEITSSSTAGEVISNSHKLTPSWVLSPVMLIANGFKNLWGITKDVK